MWRTRAVLSLLREEIAGLPHGGADTEEQWVDTMRRARRRVLIVVALDWLAILLLVTFGERAAPMLTLGPDERTVFTLAILAVAVHSGFRLGQLEKLRGVERAATLLGERDPEI